MIIFEKNIFIKSNDGFNIHTNINNKLLFDICNSTNINLYDDVDMLNGQATFIGRSVIAFDKSRNIAIVRYDDGKYDTVNADSKRFEYVDSNLDFILKL